MTRWKLTIEYQGTKYAGWQRQDGGIKSVQQSVETAIYKFCQQQIIIHVAGRTDAGVHANGQVAHFDLDYGDRELTPHDLRKALNAHLGSEPISILKAEETHDEFHARFDAVSKLYTYRVLNREAKPSFQKNLVWHIRRELNIDAMREGAKHLLGSHDFTSFRAAECQAKTPLRSLDRLDIECVGEEILFHAEARSFLHHQVRNMVGTLAQVGQNKWQPIQVKRVLDAKDRTKAGPTAPPDGLYLVEVRY